MTRSREWPAGIRNFDRKKFCFSCKHFLHLISEIKNTSWIHNPLCSLHLDRRVISMETSFILKWTTWVAWSRCLDLMCVAMPELEVSFEEHPALPRRTILLQRMHCTTENPHQQFENGSTKDYFCSFQAWWKNRRNALNVCNRYFHSFTICLFNWYKTRRSTPVQTSQVLFGQFYTACIFGVNQFPLISGISKKHNLFADSMD